MSVVAATLATSAVHGDLWLNIGYTLEGCALGLTIATVLAVPLGIVLGSSRLAYRLLRAPIEFVRPVPSVALIPLAVLVFGVELPNTLFLVAFACFWPLLFQAIYGVQDTDPIAQDTARSFGLSGAARFWFVTLPSVSPYLATGLRIASSVALLVAVTSELIVGVPGLGQAVLVAQSSGNYPLMYALIAVTGLLGLALNELMRRIERRALGWHHAPGREVAA